MFFPPLDCLFLPMSYDMVILQHSFSNCSRLLRHQCTGRLAALLPTPTHCVSGISTARAWANMYTMQLISIRAKNRHYGSNNMLDLGWKSQLNLTKRQRSAAWQQLCDTHGAHGTQSGHWRGRQIWGLIKNWGEEKSLCKTHRASPLPICLSAHMKNSLGLSPN